MEHYKGLKKIYFDEILRTLVKLGDLNNANKRILDFGCGSKQLRSFLTNINYLGYDIDPKYTDTSDWLNEDFNVFVTNETFYEMRPEQITDVLGGLRKINPTCELLFGISRQGPLNKLGAFFLQADALDKTLTSPKKEKEIITQFCDILEKKSIFGLCDVYKAVFK